MEFDASHAVLGVLTILGFLAAFLKSVGLNEVSAQVEDLQAEVDMNKATLVAVVKGVQETTSSRDPVRTGIQAMAHISGVEKYLNSVVKAVTVLLLAAIFGVGCTLQSTYVADDRKTFDAIAPVYSAYVFGDRKLSAEDRALREAVIRSWETRLTDAEKE
jgi:hypothetical protein